MATEQAVFEGWVILEVMGHRRLAGRVTEVQIAGAGFLRLDVPGNVHTEPSGEQVEREGGTQYYPPSSVYCITPVTEEAARQFAARSWQQPAKLVGLPPGSIGRYPWDDPPDDVIDLDEDDEVAG